MEQLENLKEKNKDLENKVNELENKILELIDENETLRRKLKADYQTGKIDVYEFILWKILDNIEMTYRKTKG